MPLNSDGAEEPLITHDEDAFLPEDAESTAVPGRFVWTLTFAAALSGLLFGYEYVFFSYQV
jgi:hypothetical protein